MIAVDGASPARAHGDAARPLANRGKGDPGVTAVTLVLLPRVKVIAGPHSVEPRLLRRNGVFYKIAGGKLLMGQDEPDASLHDLSTFPLVRRWRCGAPRPARHYYPRRSRRIVSLAYDMR